MSDQSTSPSRRCKLVMNYMDLKFCAWKHFPKYELPLTNRAQKDRRQSSDLHSLDRENLYAIGFRTPPADSTGLPHILEHSVLAAPKNIRLKTFLKN